VPLGRFDALTGVFVLAPGAGGFGVGVDVAARAEVVESVSADIKKVAINFFNLCST
jgi:hypothetical protein